MDFLNDHDPRVRISVRARKSSLVLEFDPIDEVDQRGGIIVVETVALLEAPERMDRPMTSDCGYDVPVRLGEGPDHSTENPVPMIGIMFHVSSIAIASSDRIGRNQP
jgi:hypothetical protein